MPRRGCNGRSVLLSIPTGDRLCEFLPRQGPVHEPGHEPHDEPVGRRERVLEEKEQLDVGRGDHHELIPLDGTHYEVRDPLRRDGVPAEQVAALPARLLVGVDDGRLNDPGVHRAGEYHAHPNVVLAQVEPQDLGAAHQGVLCAGVDETESTWAPLPARTISGTKHSIPWKGPQRLTVTIRSHWSWVMSSTWEKRATPAMLASMSVSYT